MSVFSPASSDTDVAQSMMSPLVTGWLIVVPELRSQLVLPHLLVPSTLHLLVNRWEIRSFSHWLLIHKCQQHRNNSLTMQNEETTTTCEFESRTVESAQNLRASLDECFGLMSINIEILRIGRFTSTTVKPTRSSSPWHRKSTVFVP